MPAFNVERYVAEAVESVLAQTRPVHELIVIDDGSTDGTPAILERYRRRAGVRLVRTENRGLGPARNLGASQAVGDYLYFLDSDDCMVPHGVATIEAALDMDGVAVPDLVCFGGQSFLEPGYSSDFFPSYERAIAGRFTGRGAALAALLAADNLLANAALYVVNRAFWQRGGFAFKPCYHEDEELILPLLLAAADVRLLTDQLYRRRVRPDSIMTSPVGPNRVVGYGTLVRTTLDLLANPDVRAAQLRGAVRARLRRFTSAYLSASERAGMAPEPLLILRAAWHLHTPRPMASMVRASLRRLVS